MAASRMHVQAKHTHSVYPGDTPHSMAAPYVLLLAMPQPKTPETLAAVGAHNAQPCLIAVHRPAEGRGGWLGITQSPHSSWVHRPAGCNPRHRRQAAQPATCSTRQQPPRLAGSHLGSTPSGTDNCRQLTAACSVPSDGLTTQWTPHRCLQPRPPCCTHTHGSSDTSAPQLPDQAPGPTLAQHNGYCSWCCDAQRPTLLLLLLQHTHSSHGMLHGMYKSVCAVPTASTHSHAPRQQPTPAHTLSQQT